MTDVNDPKATLKRYLQGTREALLWKLDGLDERAVRLPRTPTGTNLLGLVKHAANIEIGYLGDTFGRVWPGSDRVPFSAYDEDPQADLYATADESRDGIIDLYRRVWVFGDTTIDELPLDAPGRVPWWGDRGAVTLHRVLIHLIVDLSRHAGHADILREQLDGAAGLNPGNSNLPDGQDWPAYVTRLTALANE